MTGRRSFRTPGVESGVGTRQYSFGKVRIYLLYQSSSASLQLAILTSYTKLFYNSMKAVKSEVWDHRLHRTSVAVQTVRNMFIPCSFTNMCNNSDLHR